MQAKKLGPAVLAVQAALLAAAAMVAAPATAVGVDTGWGRLDFNYIDYDCYDGCRISGRIVDRNWDDGCLFVQAVQYGGVGNYAPQTRICHGWRDFDFRLPIQWGGITRLLLASEWRSPVNAWSRW